MTASRLDDITMDEVRLTMPVSDADLARLELGDVVYLDGVLYTAREGVYRKVVDEGRGLPPSVLALTNVNFHCSPAASVRADGSYAVEAVTATASFRFGKSMSRWFERSGAKVVVGKAGLTELAYRESGDQPAARGGLPRAAAVRDGSLRRDHLPHRRDRVVLRLDTATRRSGAFPLQRDRRGHWHGGAHQEFTRC